MIIWTQPQCSNRLLLIIKRILFASNPKNMNFKEPKSICLHPIIESLSFILDLFCFVFQIPFFYDFELFCQPTYTVNTDLWLGSEMRYNLQSRPLRQITHTLILSSFVRVLLRIKERWLLETAQRLCVAYLHLYYPFLKLQTLFTMLAALLGGAALRSENNGNMRTFMGSSIENQTPIENEADLWPTRNGTVGLSCHQITSKAEGKVKCIFLAYRRPATLTHSTVQTDRMCAAGGAWVQDADEFRA